tara:strand:+ start:44 stop:1774 length:1731 start_codon:yes stop_codon:yes gene_type:complete
MGLTLTELRKRGPRIGTFVTKFYNEEEFTFEDRTREKISEIRLGTARYNLQTERNSLIQALSTSNTSASQARIVVGRARRLVPLGSLAKTREFGGQFDDGSRAEQSLDTETYSEMLAAYCLAYRIKTGNDLELNDFIDPDTGGLNQKTYLSIKNKVVLPAAFALTRERIRNNLARYGIGALGVARFNWLDNGNATARTILANVNITKDAVVYNDKIFNFNRQVLPLIYNPYKVFALSISLPNKIKPDKWNPADIWVMTASGKRDLIRFNQKIQRTGVHNINAINNFLQIKYDEGSIIPISLKKLNPSNPHFTLMNSKYFVEQIDTSSQTNPPIIEFTQDNQDVKINFTVRTIRLANPSPNMMMMQDRIQNAIGQVVPGSEKNIRIKYNVNKQQLEVEYDQTRSGVKLSEARHGSIGRKLLNDIISSTSRQGIDKLNELKEPYVRTNYPLEINQTYFTSDKIRVDEGNKATALRYLSDIWELINDDIFPQYWEQRFGRNDNAVRLKITSGEIGVSINEIPNTKIKNRVIQNLYNAASSIGVMKGLNKEERQIVGAAGINDTTTIRADFVGGIHGKVF